MPKNSLDNTPSPSLKIVGAKENNLKDLSLEIPHDHFIAVTGLSGSGKSSLAFETVYAEGQRRYIETFSPYTRQFLDKIKRPDADTITNVRPAIAVEQRVRVTSSRSTVASITNLGEYLKIIWSNLSLPFCPNCKHVISCLSSKALAERLSIELKKRGEPLVYICAEIKFANEKKIRLAEIERLISLGYSRAIDIDSNELYDLSDLQEVISYSREVVYLALSRVKEGKVIIKSLTDAIESAFNLSYQKARSCVVFFPKTHKPSLQIINDENNLFDSSPLLVRYFEELYCPKTDTLLPKAKASLFNPNHPAGACATCKGFGRILEIDIDKCVPNKSLSLSQAAIIPWSSASTTYEYRKLIKFCQANGIDTKTSWYSLSAQEKELILNTKSREYRGLLIWFKALERKAYKMHVRVFLAKYRKQSECPTCHGNRLRQEALAFRVEDYTLPEIYKMPIKELVSWFEKLNVKLNRSRKLSRDLEAPLRAIYVRLKYLFDLGLPYLTLDRAARTLSGGETQRVNLATALGSDLISTHFVLDEPSVGLHARDSQRLIEAVKILQKRGNSLLVVEHDPEFIYAADKVIELGPKAGKEGGQIIYNGDKNSWPGIKINPVLKEERKDLSRKISIQNARSRNLKDITCDIPLNSFTVLCGVSGSGKSTLVHEVIKKAWEERSYPANRKSYQAQLFGLEQIESLEIVDQSPLSKSPRGNIATYSKIWDEARDLLAETESARLLGLTRSSFSFNVAGGRCPECQGGGFIKEEMQFLSDIYLPCEICLGKRFQSNVLEVRWQDKNVDDLLNTTVDEAEIFFAQSTKVRKICRLLSQLGLGHLRLGHPLSHLSGGEAQRLKLVPHLDGASKDTLLIFDEPTTGLHHYDVLKLIELFRDLIKQGNSILVIEHNLEVISAADWLVELGPEGGEEGGMVIASTTPKLLIAQETSLTGKYLNLYCNSKISNNKEKSNSYQSQTERSSPAKELKILGAREHNLKNIDLKIPLDKVVALCGVSGSGKSTIAKDIIYAEGQRRYLDCLSPYARQFIKELARPEVDEIINIKPTVCVFQHTFQPSKLSTVGTLSEVYNYLRLLFSKLGVQHCPNHPNLKISSSSIEEITEEILKNSGSDIRILAPIVKNRKGTHREIFERAIKAEIFQVRVDNIFLTPSMFRTGKGLEKNKVHSIDFVVGKFKKKNVNPEFVSESVKMALQLGGGALSVLDETGERVYSNQRACPECGQGFLKLDPEDFSFSSRRGRCHICQGSAIDDKGKPCQNCQGSRLNRLASNVKLFGQSISQISKLTAQDLLTFFANNHFSPRESILSETVLSELKSRAQALIRVGLEYLPLSRSCSHLSGGELQRLRLAAAIGSPLTGTLYIFDEPSAGLHPYDNNKVLNEISQLKDRGNSVLLIEHEPQSILSAEHIIDIGPGGGRNGGEVVFNDSITKFLQEIQKSSTKSPTALAIANSLPLTNSCTKNSTLFLKVKNASRNNINRLNLEIPLHAVVTFAGVSGAGKSSLLRGIIAETINDTLNGKGEKSFVSDFAEIKSDCEIYRLIEIDQKPIGSTSRSTPASYLGVWDEIRKLFAATLEARSRGWKNSFFSYNSGKGRCSACHGLGKIKLEMNFLPDAYSLCDECRGERFTSDAISVKYLGLSINQVLKLTLEEALPIFINHKKIHQPLKLACELGLEYLSLGQSSATLSGGESQRLKLVSELSGTRKGHTIYILDEPTTGLHKHDVIKLLNCLRRLVNEGHSIFLIEHDFDVLRNCDWIVELGPGAGESGGKIIYNGLASKLAGLCTPWGELLLPGHLVDK